MRVGQRAFTQGFKIGRQSGAQSTSHNGRIENGSMRGGVSKSPATESSCLMHYQRGRQVCCATLQERGIFSIGLQDGCALNLTS